MQGSSEDTCAAWDGPQWVAPQSRWSRALRPGRERGLRFRGRKATSAIVLPGEGAACGPSPPAAGLVLGRGRAGAEALARAATALLEKRQASASSQALGAPP